MRRAAKPLGASRQPRQTRSRERVEQLLEAAAEVFVERGYAGATTNHIAARAGVSVGSLYQYFPSKDAILIALAERHVARSFAAVLERVREKRRRPVPELLRALVDALVDAHRAEPGLHRVIFEEAHFDARFHRRLDELDAGAMQVARELVDERCHELAIENPEIATLLVVQVLEGLTHAMVLRHPEMLTRPEFRDELVRLLERYLLGGRHPGTGTGGKLGGVRGKSSGRDRPAAGGKRRSPRRA